MRSTRSAPAFSERTAAVATDERRATARASSESVITAPRKWSRARSRPRRMAGDCDAMWPGSTAG